MNSSEIRYSIRDIMLLTCYVAILLTLYFGDDVFAIPCTALSLLILRHYIQRFSVLRAAGLFLSFGAIVGYITCHIVFQVPFFFFSPRFGLFCFCMILGGSFGIVLYLLKIDAENTYSNH